MNRKILAFMTAVLVLLPYSPAPAADDTATSIGVCRAIVDDTERLACFDQLAASMSTAPAPAPEPMAQPPVEPLPLSDDVGNNTVKGHKPDRPEYTAVVTRCEKAKHEKRKYFFMENGQVWQQANAGRLSFRDRGCQFAVTLKKDYFGWVMTIPSEGRELRVRRIR